MNPTTAADRVTEAVQFLEALATAMVAQGWATHVEIPRGRPPALYVRNPRAPVLSEHIYAWPSTNGSWFYWWSSWGQIISPATHLGTREDRRNYRARAQTEWPSQ